MPIYLDHAATSPMPPEVLSAYVEALTVVGNPASIHSQGQNAKRMLEEAHVAATPGIDFDPVHGKQFVRFSYARSPAEMREAVERIARWLGNS